MILVDTSVWVDHFRKSSKRLVELLEEDQVLVHPFVIGELGLGGLVNRDEILRLLEALPVADEATHQETLTTVRRWNLDGRGIGWVDAHLFASALLSDAELWTADNRLALVCSEAEIAFS